MKLVKSLIAVICFTSVSYADFVKDNTKSFSDFRLNNGISVVVKHQPGEISAMTLVMKNGNSLVPIEKAGLERATLTLMGYESKKYSEIKKRSLLQATSASIGSATFLDSSVWNLKVINKYFDEVFDLYSDLFLNPNFTEKYYEETMTNFKNSFRDDMSDGMNRASHILNLEFFANHNYRSFLHDEKSLSNITFDDIKKYFANNITAERITIFYVGSLDKELLKKKLNETFGKVKKTNFSDPKPAPFSSTIKMPLLLDSYSDLKKDVSYVRCNFMAPHPNESDYFALYIGLKIMSDVLNEIVRTKRSMVYSVWSNVRENIANYGSLVAFKTNNPMKVYDHILESINYSAEGKAFSHDSKDGFVDVDEVLDFYKASFQTEYFAELQSNSQIASKLADAFVTTGDYRSYLTVLEKVKALRASDIKAAIVKYVKNGNKYCSISANPLVIEELKKDHESYGKEIKTIKIQ